MIFHIEIDSYFSIFWDFVSIPFLHVFLRSRGFAFNLKILFDERTFAVVIPDRITFAGFSIFIYFCGLLPSTPFTVVTNQNMECHPLIRQKDANCGWQNDIGSDGFELKIDAFALHRVAATTATQPTTTREHFCHVMVLIRNIIYNWIRWPTGLRVLHESWEQDFSQKSIEWIPRKTATVSTD